MAKWDKSPSHHNKMVIYKAGSGEFPERKRLVWMSFYPSKGFDGNNFKNTTVATVVPTFHEK